MSTEIKLTKKQKEIVKKMREGWVLMVGQSETSGRIYQMVTKGYDRTYFNSTVFSNLLQKDIIYQQNSPPFDYILTDRGKTIKL